MVHDGIPLINQNQKSNRVEVEMESPYLTHSMNRFLTSGLEFSWFSFLGPLLRFLFLLRFGRGLLPSALGLAPPLVGGTEEEGALPPPFAMGASGGGWAVATSAILIQWTIN